jgi:hypothetical protein
VNDLDQDIAYQIEQAIAEDDPFFGDDYVPLIDDTDNSIDNDREEWK